MSVCVCVCERERERERERDRERTFDSFKKNLAILKDGIRVSYNL